MLGLEKKEGCANWQGCYRLPQHRWNVRPKLRELGIHAPNTQEHKHSLRVADQGKAERLYAKEAQVWHNKMEVLEETSESGSNLSATSRELIRKQEPLKYLERQGRRARIISAGSRG